MDTASMQIAIVGGGRWARTIATVLCSLPPCSHCVIIHTHNAADVLAWAKELRLGERLRTAEGWPDFVAKRHRPEAVIIANRVRDHFATALQALCAGVPVMVEKPMAWPRNKIADLREAAQANRTLVATSNVFLFARYFESFGRRVATAGPHNRICFTWVDGPADVRRGEKNPTTRA